MDERAHLGLTEAPQKHEMAVACQLSEHLREPRCPAHLGLAIQGEDQQRHRAELARQEPQQQQSRHVRGVQVIEDQCHRLHRSHVAEEGRAGIKQPKASLIAAEERRHVGARAGRRTHLHIEFAQLPVHLDVRPLFSDAAAQVKEARIWAGIHFRNSCNVGQAVSEAIADYVVDNFLLPVETDDEE